MAGVFGEIVNDVRGLQGLAAMQMQMDENKAAQERQKIGMEALNKYRESAQLGKPDDNAFTTAVMNVPDAAKNVLASIGIKDAMQKKDAASFALKAANIIESPEQFVGAIDARIKYLQDAGRDPKDSIALREQYLAGDKEGVRRNLKGVAAALVGDGTLDPKIYESTFGTPEKMSEYQQKQIDLQNRELDLRGKQLAASSTQKPGDIERNWAIYNELLKTDPEKAARFGNAARFEPQSGDVELQQKLAEAKVSGKTISEAKANLPKIESANKFVNGYVDAVLKHPGRPWSTGLLSLAPTVRGTKQADFRNKMEQIGGQSFLQAFETLRGGGQITQIEGEKATAAINRMKASTSDEEFNSAAQDFKDVIGSALKNARDLASGKSLTIQQQQEQAPASQRYKVTVKGQQ